MLPGAWRRSAVSCLPRSPRRLIGIGVSAIKTAASFEKSMNVLEYVTGGTADTMQKMQDQALQLGADTVFSAGEAAEGMVELAKAGMDTEDVMDSISGVMDLAAAGQISVAEAAELASSTLDTFDLEAEKIPPKLRTC